MDGYREMGAIWCTTPWGVRTRRGTLEIVVADARCAESALYR